MRIKKGTLFCLATIVLFGLSACSDNQKDISIEQEQFIWHETREKPFGQFDYPKISKNEGLSLLKDKFKLKVPTLIAQSETLMEKELVTDEVKADTPEYTLYAEGDELRIKGYYPLVKGDQLEAIVAIEFSYQFNQKEKEVRLKNQSFTVVNAGASAEFPQEKFIELLKRTVDLIDVPKTTSERSIKNFEKEYEQPDDRPEGQRVKVYSNNEEMEEKKGISQTIIVEFNGQKGMRGIQALIVDNTE
ncbi:hypothetical protein [Enterococcus sp. AZ126]|uniref:hypothetical protein n=1 Tax=Enterococcus sp. AZ126 TaxID=2774635 RepID=UPI003F27F8C2